MRARSLVPLVKTRDFGMTPKIEISNVFKLRPHSRGSGLAAGGGGRIGFRERGKMNVMEEPQGRPVRESQSEMAEIVLPNDANPLGALLGGRLMHWIDLAGAMAAHRHSRNYVVTASVDHIDFLVPVRVGDLVILRSSVNRVFRTSMEVGVKVWVENYISSARHHVASAHLTFVAVDAGGRRLGVAAVIPETGDERRRFEDAGRRRDLWRAESARRNAAR